MAEAEEKEEEKEEEGQVLLCNATYAHTRADVRIYHLQGFFASMYESLDADEIFCYDTPTVMRLLDR